MSQNKQARSQVHLIGQFAGFIGHSFMYRAGSQVFINKRVDDFEAKKSVYQGYYHSELTKSGHEVQIDAKSLKFTRNESTESGRNSHITLNAELLDLSGLPPIPF
ncbi:MAG: hypothetical protein RSD49_06450 [Hafnia sp.]